MIETSGKKKEKELQEEKKWIFKRCALSLEAAWQRRSVFLD